MFFHILENNCIIFSSFEAGQAEIVTFCQKAIEAPSIDKMNKQSLLKQINTKLFRQCFFKEINRKGQPKKEIQVGSYLDHVPYRLHHPLWNNVRNLFEGFASGS